MNKIPILDLSDDIRQHKAQYLRAIEQVLDDGSFINGPAVKGFEQKAKEYLGCKHAIGLNSGTDALVIALRALGIGSGDEVITTPFTFFATIEAIEHVGATPVIVDIDPATLNISTNEIAKAITSSTRAVIPVHLFGLSCDMHEIQTLANQHGLKIVEDTAQAFGGNWKDKKLGCVGDVGCYSFFPSKNLGAFGDGGLLTTDDDDVADLAIQLRAHGGKDKYYNTMVGYNSRLDSIQAAVLSEKIARMDTYNEGRRRVASRYNEAFSKAGSIVTPSDTADSRHVYHQYTLRITDGRRDELRDLLNEDGIQSMIYYPVPVHKLPLYESKGWTFVESERAASEVISLPVWPGMDEAVQQRVIDSVLKHMA